MALLTWRDGVITFRETPLADAVAEFNRYNPRQIVIEDEQLGAIRLSGKFQATQAEAFVRLLQARFPVDVRGSEAQVVLSRRAAMD